MFKLNMLTWKALYEKSPKYILDMITEKSIGNELRSGKSKILDVPRTNLKSMGDKAFSVIAPKSWNKLPCDLRMNDNCLSFKSRLKSYYLDMAYGGSN